MPQKTQSYKNHAQYVPLYHFVTFALLLMLLVGSVYFLVTADKQMLFPAILLLITVLTLMLTTIHSRAFALKVQDRAIRAEEQFRYFIVTGKRLPQELTVQQLIALRFASDDELEALADQAIRESMSPSAIKQAVKNWRADHHRA